MARQRKHLRSERDEEEDDILVHSQEDSCSTSNINDEYKEEANNNSRVRSSCTHLMQENLTVYINCIFIPLTTGTSANKKTSSCGLNYGKRNTNVKCTGNFHHNQLPQQPTDSNQRDDFWGIIKLREEVEHHAAVDVGGLQRD